MPRRERNRGVISVASRVEVVRYPLLTAFQIQPLDAFGLFFPPFFCNFIIILSQFSPTLSMQRRPARQCTGIDGLVLYE